MHNPVHRAGCVQIWLDFVGIFYKICFKQTDFSKFFFLNCWHDWMLRTSRTSKEKIAFRFPILGTSLDVLMTRYFNNNYIDLSVACASINYIDLWQLFNSFDHRLPSISGTWFFLPDNNLFRFGMGYFISPFNGFNLYFIIFIISRISDILSFVSLDF